MKIWQVVVFGLLSSLNCFAHDRTWSLSLAQKSVQTTLGYSAMVESPGFFLNKQGSLRLSYSDMNQSQVEFAAIYSQPVSELFSVYGVLGIGMLIDPNRISGYLAMGAELRIPSFERAALFGEFGSMGSKELRGVSSQIGLRFYLP